MPKPSVYVTPAIFSGPGTEGARSSSAITAAVETGGELTFAREGGGAALTAMFDA